MKNIQQYLQSIENRKEILKDASNIYEKANNEKIALLMLKEFRKKWYQREREAVKHFWLFKVLNG